MFVDADELRVETPMVAAKRKGRKLPPGRIRAIRNLLYTFLRENLDLTPGDAERVMATPVTSRQFRATKAELQPYVDKHGVLTLMSMLAKDEEELAGAD